MAQQADPPVASIGSRIKTAGEWFVSFNWVIFVRGSLDGEKGGYRLRGSAVGVWSIGGLGGWSSHRVG